ncbi:BTAD domain-containing putative transcriptional regulator [Streptomyces sp. NPDC000594]|uniref:AfsR/SARP family transcriptional regulator n=1 Tax=Streptomyces sp. NPDC000594 TaxID=3154261 RepID=UPI00331796AB
MLDSAVRFEVMGSLRASAGDRSLPLGPPRRRAVLVALLLGGPRPVPADRIIAMVWGDDAPAHALNLVQKYVSGLRRCLPASLPLTHSEAGYALGTPGGFACDLLEFEELFASARALSGSGRTADAAETLARAVALVRGPLAEGTEGRGIELERDRFQERLLSAREELYALEVSLGRGERHLPELVRLIGEHPLRERPHALLMRTLADSGRQVEALHAYARIRDRLVEEYGIEPGAGLREAHRFVLNAVPPAERPPEAPPVPHQLPNAVRDFTGRTAEIARVTDRLRSGGMPVVCVEGTAGIGKTALAVHCAHRVADDFPDGRLFIDLRGFDRLGAADPSEVLGSFLRALGVAAQHVPTDVLERGTRFRSLLATRRVLIVLDNAADAHHVRHLLPGAPGCAVLVTSRRALVSLAVHEDAHRVVLPVLSPGESAELLRSALGGTRPLGRKQDPAVAEISRLCGHLPLALRVVAAGSAVAPHFDLSSVARELAAAGPLAGASVADDERASVGASLDLSYQRLDDRGRRALRLLGLLPGPDLTPAAAAALTGVDEGAVRPALSALTAANLLVQHAPGRFRFPHDLLREYAWNRAGDEEPAASRQDALNRLMGWYTQVATVLDGRVGRIHVVGQESRTAEYAPVSAEDAEAELRNLAAAVEHTAEHGPYAAAWTLAGMLRETCKRRSRVPEWLAVARAGLRAAQRGANPRAEAELSLSLVDASLTAGLVDAAERHVRRARHLSEAHDWPDLLAASREQLGRARWTTGALDEARRHLTESVRLHSAGPDHLRTALAYGALGRVELDAGAPGAARRLYLRCLRLGRSRAHRGVEAMALVELGLVHEALGDPRTAALSLEAGLALSGGDRALQRSEALSRSYLGALRARAGDRVAARALCLAGIRAAEELGDLWAQAECRNAAGRAMSALGFPHEAAEHHREALRIARGLRFHRAEQHALAGLRTVGAEPLVVG